MVSKTLAALDAWLALAEEVLAEQDALQDRQPAAPGNDHGQHDHGLHHHGADRRRSA